MVFDFPLTEVRVRPHQVTALHLMVALAMCGTGAVLMQFYPPAGNWSFILVIAGAILLMVSMFRNKWIRDAKVNRLLRIAELMILLCLASYLAIEGMLTPAAIMGVLSATVLLALIWEQQTRHPVCADRRHRRKNAVGIAQAADQLVGDRPGIVQARCIDDQLP